MDILNVFPILLLFEKAPNNKRSKPTIGFFPMISINTEPARTPSITADMETRKEGTFFAFKGLFITFALSFFIYSPPSSQL